MRKHPNNGNIERPNKVWNGKKGQEVGNGFGTPKVLLFLKYGGIKLNIFVGV